jgi:signal transduction histidine kinase/CheY-like chemotaxis protein
VSTDDLERVRAGMRTALQKGAVRGAEYSLVRKNGSLVPVESSTSIITRPGGAPQAFMQVLRDLTERKRAEESHRKLEAQILHSQKLESLGVLAGGIAHDFNNILTGILGYIDLARIETPPDSSARRLMEEAAKNSHRAASLTKQMLAYSGKGRFVVRPMNLSTLVTDTARLLEISIAKKCSLRYDLAAQLPACEADATQMGQILMNLVINASEAIGDQCGVIGIATGAMHCDRAYLAEAYLDEGLLPGLYIFLEVSDSGCGMTPETREKIFDPFFSTKFTGRGLGLAAVLGIVRGHRGAVKVYSEPGKGSTFKVLLRATTQPAVEEKAPPAADEEFRGSGTVLVVDDEQSVRDLARDMFTRLGFMVLSARDGCEGVRVFRDHVDDIRLVLLDMTMPRLDGVETFREMRRMRSDLRVLLSSGYNEQTATSRFVGKGLAGFIQKPYSFDQLIVAVKQAMERKPAGQN